MDLIEKKERLCSLYDLYKALLTDKQREYFEDYYFLDLSLSEVGQSYDVSRNAVFDQIKKIASILEKYENLLHLKEKEEKMEAIMNQYKDNPECATLIKKIKNLE